MEYVVELLSPFVNEGPMFVKEFSVIFDEEEPIEIDPNRTVYKYATRLKSVLGKHCHLEIQYLPGFEIENLVIDLGLVSHFENKLQRTHELVKVVHFETPEVLNVSNWIDGGRRRRKERGRGRGGRGRGGRGRGRRGRGRGTNWLGTNKKFDFHLK